LAIVVAEGNPKNVRALADLARADLAVALCGPAVPAGRYAREALQKAGVEVRSRSDEPSVKALVAKIELLELDAGIAYVTDVRGARVTGIEIPAEHDVVAAYPIAVLSGGEPRAGAESFVAFVLSDAGRRILAEHGFGLP
jgi:molybdate transport system substrate-binding protein